MSDKFINESLLAEIKKYYASELTKENLCITRYLKSEDLLKSLNGDYMYFSNPANWDDPFEEAVVRRLNVRGYSVFGICFTTSAYRNEEAFWRTCKEENKFLSSFSFKYSSFMEHLNSAVKSTLKTEDYKIYSGLVDYSLQRKDLEKDLTSKAISQMTDDEELVKLLFRKRVAYSYENELRVIIKVKNGSKDEPYLNVGNFNLKTLIKHVRLEPLPKNILKMLEDDALRTTFKEKYIKSFTEEIKNEELKKSLKITVSRLDDFEF
ncbi:MAG: hypothetical protein KBT11_08410 [Treponema sp.]|nr:hypothetical protein [Candidatus Treponema equifaecale]